MGDGGARGPWCVPCCEPLRARASLHRATDPLCRGVRVAVWAEEKAKGCSAVVEQRTVVEHASRTPSCYHQCYSHCSATGFCCSAGQAHQEAGDSRSIPHCR